MVGSLQSAGSLLGHQRGKEIWCNCNFNYDLKSRGEAKVLSAHVNWMRDIISLCYSSFLSLFRPNQNLWLYHPRARRVPLQTRSQSVVRPFSALFSPCVSLGSRSGVRRLTMMHWNWWKRWQKIRCWIRGCNKSPSTASLQTYFSIISFQLSCC